MGLRTGSYHAGLTDAERARVQERFLAGRLDVIVATNAFGMGVDKPDIRFVVHGELPGSVEAYYQEVGRAGRDGLPSRCTLLFSPADVRTQEFFLSGANPSSKLFRDVWRQLGEGLAEDEIEAGSGSDGAVDGPRRDGGLLRRSAEVPGWPRGRGPPLDGRRGRSRRGATASGSTRWCAMPSPEGVAPGSSTTISRAVPGAVPRRAVASATCASAGVMAPVVPSTSDELLQVRIALSGVGRLSGRFGVERVAQVLVGGQGAKSSTAAWIESRPTASSRRSRSTT